MSPEVETEKERLASAENWLEDHGDYLFRYAKSRVFDVPMAEDLVQETFFTAIKQLSTFRGESTVRTWLTGILRFKILNYYRKKGREVPFAGGTEGGDGAPAWFDPEGHWIQETDDAGMGWEPDPSVKLDQKEFWDALQSCLSMLPPKAAAVFVQRELEFLDSKEITDKMEISESNLWVLLHRARNQLRRCLQINWKTE